MVFEAGTWEKVCTDSAAHGGSTERVQTARAFVILLNSLRNQGIFWNFRMVHTFTAVEDMIKEEVQTLPQMNVIHLNFLYIIKIGTQLQVWQRRDMVQVLIYLYETVFSKK